LIYSAIVVFLVHHLDSSDLGYPISSMVTVIAITAALYAVAKGITGFVPTPWGVGQILLFIFVPVFFAIVSYTLPVAIGAAIGTFIGDLIFLVPSGGTSPALSLAAGVPANFIAFYVFGTLVKKYRSWSSFIALSVASITLGNFLAAALVATLGPFLFAPLAALTSPAARITLTIGLTVLWDTTMIPTVMIAIPPLLRAVRPLVGRSTILVYYPEWSNYEVKRLLPTSLVFAFLFILVGAFFFLTPLGEQYAAVKTLVFVTAASLAIFGPIVGIVAGSKRLVKETGS
jgi:hypothetical protein